jgi:nucleoside phosphorylase
MAVALAMLDERHSSLPQDHHDHNTYALGSIGGHNLVLACLPAGMTGTMSAARVATQMLRTFTWLRFGLMVGIGGGVPSEEHDIRLGDVVVGMPSRSPGGVIQYDFGMTVQRGRFEQTGSLNRPPIVLLTALANLQAKHDMEGYELTRYLSEMTLRNPKMGAQFAYPGAQYDLLYDAGYKHTTGRATCSECDTVRLVNREPRSSVDPVIHYGLIASGNQVIRDGSIRERLGRELGVLCFDMEAAGLMNSFPCLVIRGICDYADSHKNDQWQRYAAATAAAYAKELLYFIPGNQVTGTRTAGEATEESESTPRVVSDSQMLERESSRSEDHSLKEEPSKVESKAIQMEEKIAAILANNEALKPLHIASIDRVGAKRYEKNLARLLIYLHRYVEAESIEQTPRGIMNGAQAYPFNLSVIISCRQFFLLLFLAD